MNRTSILVFYLVVIASAVTYADESSYIGELPPVAVGGPCSQEEAPYLWTTEKRTPWRFVLILIVPEEFQDNPIAWEQADDFLSQVSGIVGEGPYQSQDLVEAAVSVSANMIQGSSVSMATLSRDKSMRNRSLECENGVWTLVSDTTTTEIDDSDWIELDAYDVVEVESTLAAVDRLVAEINLQPGADIRDRHSFEQIPQE